MKIRHKLLAGLLGIPVIFAAVAIFLIAANRQVQRDSRELAAFQNKLEMGSGRLTAALITGQKAAEELMAEKYRGRFEPEERVAAEDGARRAEELIKASDASIDHAVNSLTEVTQLALYDARKSGNQIDVDDEVEELKELQEMRATFDDYKLRLNRYVQAANSNLDQADEVLNEEVERQYEEKLLPLVQSYAAARDEEVNRKTSEIEQSISRISRLVAQSVIGSMLLAILIGLFISHSFSQPLKKLAAAATEIGKGGLVSGIKVKSHDEIGQLGRAFNQMADNLSRTTVSKDYVDSIIKSMGDSLVVTSPEGAIVTINAATCRMLGYTEAELLGQPLEILFTTDDGETLSSDLDQPGAVTDMETVYRAKDGRKIPIAFSRAAMQHDSKQSQGIVCVAKDITERKRIEAELKTHEHSMSEAQRIAHLGSWEHNAGSGEVKWSREEWRIFGLDPRALGPPFEEFLTMVHPDDRHIVKRINEKSPQSREDFGYDYRIIRPDGAVRVLRANARILCDERGQVVKITGTDQDITEQKQIETELRQRDLQLVEAQHIALLGNWEWDTATNMTKWSDALYHVYGIHPQDLTPTYEGYLSLVHPDDRKKVSEIAETVLQTGHGCSYGHRVIWPDQSLHFLHVNLRVELDETGHPVRLFGTAQDVTDRVQLEEELKQARDVAIESARLKSEFLANMSHEIRTPMNGVIGMTGLLLDTELDADQRDFAETIRSSGDALLTIINDILDFSKIEAGKLQFETLDFLLNSTVEDTIELLAERAHDKKIELACLVNSDVPTALRGDPGRLRQVLTNVLGNAIKFTERGEVILRAEKQSETEHDVVIRFQITDTGIGISEAAQRNLFSAFTQADGSTTRKYGGTGLGLAISKQLVELMGGEIGINSTLGQGSTVWFTAKFAKQPADALSVAPPPVSLDHLRVLIVDDNATNRKILSHQVGSWGMINHEADSGARALELLRSAAAQDAAYDLAILDLMMPGMDGFELARKIKSDPEIAAVNLVMLTSFGERGHGTTARAAGVAAYLVKPVRQSQLFDCLANVISAATAAPARNVSPSPAKLGTRHTLKESSVISHKIILLAEDNVVNQKVALRQLLKLGYRADAVANGRETLEALARISYDLVLMDCQMPEMDGYETTGEIRRREGTTKHTLIVAMTANALDGDREKCIAAGMDDYVSKPVRREELGAVLERMFADPGNCDQLSREVARVQSFLQENLKVVVA